MVRARPSSATPAGLEFAGFHVDGDLIDPPRLYFNTVDQFQKAFATHVRGHFGEAFRVGASALGKNDPVALG